MSNSELKKRASRRWLAIMGGVLVLLAAVGGGAALLNGGGATREDVGLTHTVQREPLTISVTESGTVESRDRVVVRSQVEGNATILYLIPEGTIVEEGDLLIEMDATGFEDELAEERMELEDARAGVISARENLAVVENQAEADIAQAELDHRFAQQDLEKYRAEGGEYQMQLNEAEARIALAEAEMEQARQRRDGSRELFEKQYISETELQSDELAFQRAQLDLEMARQEKRLLERYTYQRQIAQLESDVEQTAMALERARRKATADIAQAEAQLNARQASLNREEQGVAQLERQIENSTIHAPTGGMVVYAPQGNRWSDEVLEEGTSVRERQELIYLPTANQMSATVNVHESALTKVAVGQRVRLTVDALPNASFTGEVKNIAIMAEDGGWRNPDLKEYATRIDINEASQALRPGMTCQAEILVAHHADVLTVPLQTVLRIDGRPTVFVVGENGQPRARAIEIGMDNNRKVHVVAGLEEGERVLLDPPLDRAEREAFGIPEDADIEAVASDEEANASENTDTEETAVNGEAGETDDDDGDDAQLSQEQMQMLRGLRRMNEYGMLDRLELSDEVRSEVDQALQQLEQGQTPELSDETQRTLRAKFNAMRRQFQQRQNSGDAGARGDGGQRQ